MSRIEAPIPNLPWIQVSPGAPYFQTEEGESWTPIGQNDAITWPDLQGLFRRRDLAGAERYVASLAAHGVTTMRLMLEYAQGRHRFIERPVGTFPPAMVRLWDDLFAICARQGVRILLTPFDTFWMWLKWKHHPYNRANGGPCRAKSRLLTCPDSRAAIKRRLLFATERWGGSGALFAWDLWNEIHPAYSGDDPGCFAEFVEDVSETLRRREIELYGRSHPQTVSVFGPVLLQYSGVDEAILRHPRLDFASTHFYEQGTIDHPRDTVAPAVSTGRLVRDALADVPPERPFFDSEHGPIHTFKDHHRTLPEPFDDEYFRHIQWAHLASGGAGGGMRWPNRHPHRLTPGMREAQKALAGFLPLIDWTRFRRRNLNSEIGVEGPGCTGFACGDREQAVVWILRADVLRIDTLRVDRDRKGMLRQDAEPVSPAVAIPGLAPGRYRVTFWDTVAGRCAGCVEAEPAADGRLTLSLPPMRTDLAMAVRSIRH
jgi:mannan endo-1,4-beta-mannosidase